MCITPSASLKKRNRGASLVEIVIVMLIMTLILGATHSFLSSGVFFYRNTVQSLEVQQQALVGLTLMASEMENSNLDKIVLDGDAVILPSVVAGDGSRLTTENGNQLWQSFVCFLPMVIDEDNTLLVRKHDAINPGVSFPPNPLNPTDGTIRDFAYFENAPSNSVLARYLDTLVATKSTDAITLELTINFSTTRTSDKMTIQSEVYPKN